MNSSPYQEYLYLIGKLKDVHNLTMDVNHRDVHTFYRGKKPLFKLLFGTLQNEIEPCIIVSFHIDLFHAEAISWFIAIYKIDSAIRLHDSYIEDDRGDFFLGSDAVKLQHIFLAQEILAEYLDTKTEEEIKKFVESEVYGSSQDGTQSFDSQKDYDKAVHQFERMRKPGDDDNVH